ncbi:MAG TPA: J domain-containing protein [Rhodanobacteraceae bacterium]|nr:J domain-containing protein [Rhodanobacteraceae bacterium]
MSSDTDFLLLYEELGLSPGRCSLDEFKRAYRRRVSSLHPDRHPGGDGEAPEAMRRLTTLYSAAMAFERRFGRLPGADPAAGRRSSPAGSFAGHSGLTMASVRREPSLPVPEPGSLRKRVLLALLILLALAWSLWGVGTMVH